MRRLAPVLSLLLLPVLPLLAAAPVGASAPQAPVGGLAAEVDIDPPTITWGECDYYEAPVECAAVPLPLDYDDPDGPTTTVHVSRVPASGERIGSLFVNPGGPGGSAYDFATAAGDLIGPGISERFDVVGVEPRGIGVNPAAFCRLPRGEVPGFPPVPYPLTDRQERAWIAGDRAVNRHCEEERSAITDHLSTADHVRDIDVVRQALGEEQLSFYGISYGSIIGQTYAAMFPDRVRAIVIDGVLDPVAWTSGGARPEQPSTFRLRSGEGAYEALTAAFDECDRVGRDRCALAGHAKQTWLRLYRVARRGELKVDRNRIRPQDLVSNALGSLYSADAIPWLMRFLRSTERKLDGDRRAATASASAWDRLQELREERERIGPYAADVASGPGAGRSATTGYGRWWVGFEGVLCSDAVNPSDPGAWRRYGDVADRTQPWFGRLWTWAGSRCAGWPGTGGDDAFRGPWATATSTPLLVVGNTHDPATPISGARAANRLFAGSVLLTLDGWGHGALGESSCVAEKMAAYLIDQVLPGASTWCRPDRPLFR